MGLSRDQVAACGGLNFAYPQGQAAGRSKLSSTNAKLCKGDAKKVSLTASTGSAGLIEAFLPCWHVNRRIDSHEAALLTAFCRL